MRPTHLSLFSGIGGLDLAAEAAGFQTVGQCEAADFPTRILEKHWPRVPRWRDIRELTRESFHAKTGLWTTELISGGFPCQPFSAAGKRRGRDDDRFLWPEMLRVIQEIRPTWIVGENVPGIINMALDDCLADLENQDYAVWTLVFPACAVDAPHRRDRVAIIAYADRDPRRTWWAEPERQQRQTRPPDGGGDVAHTGGAGLQGKQQHGTPDPRERQPESPGSAGERRETLADAHGTERQGAIEHSYQTGSARPSDGCFVSDPHDGSGTVRRYRELQPAQGAGRSRRDHAGGTPEHGGGERRTAQPGLGRGDDGLPAWMDSVRAGWRDGSWEAGIPKIATGVPDRVNRLKALGNAVVPAQFYPIFRAIVEAETS